MADAIFRVTIPGKAIAPDVLGVWETVAAGEEALEPESALWEANLPAGDLRLEAMLQENERRVADVALALPEADRRLRDFTLRYQEGGESFSVSAFEDREPEMQLAAILDVDGEGESYGWPKVNIGQIVADVQSFSDQMKQVVTLSNVINSRVEGRLIGQSRVDWSGDMSTYLAPTFSTTHITTHERAVSLALATSQAWKRIAIYVAVSGVQLGLAVPSGIGAIRALPAIWGYVNGILDEYRRIRELQRQLA